MHPAFILMIAIQVALVYHAISRGHGWGWATFVLMFPPVGPIVYLLMIVLPEIRDSFAMRRAARRMKRAVDPDGERRQRADDLDATNTVDNRLRLADELVAQGRAAEAIPLYEACLAGPFARDPDIQLLLAKALFADRRFVDARDALDRLIRDNPEFKSQEGHLLYARTVEALGDAARARHEYDVLAGYASGPEAKCRYAQFLKAQGEGERARRLFAEVVATARRAPHHYRKLHREWVELAERESVEP